ncbi:UNVERIFIED_CONTAM: hypothetical protein PYX00_008822 [Menopon gallinae]|uniref:Uncharacterized protein n=1 Tax=Menopon gallinae TaxID=328185 RepID=A0AAW2HPN8_9NEOP
MRGWLIGSQSPDPFKPRTTLQRSPYKGSSSLGYLTSTPEKNAKRRYGLDESEELPPELREITSMMRTAETVEEILAGCRTAKKELRTGVLRLIGLIQEVFCNARSGKYGPNPKRTRVANASDAETVSNVKDASTQTVSGNKLKAEMLAQEIWSKISSCKEDIEYDHILQMEWPEGI